MNIEDLKLTFLNSGALIVSFTDIEDILKIALLGVSIVYTVLKIVDLRKKNETTSE